MLVFKIMLRKVVIVILLILIVLLQFKILSSQNGIFSVLALQKNIKQRDQERRDAKKSGSQLVAQKRQPKGPEPEKTVDISQMQLLRPLKYEFIV